jgi:uncharacterized damage-inducible protein DinB
MVEPWLRGTHTEVDALRRQVLHALELAAEDATRWASPLTESELHACPHNLPSVAFQMRHMVRSLDRLLTYAEERPLTDGQLAALKTEHEPSPPEALFSGFHACLRQAMRRVLAMNPDEYELIRHVGRDRLPTTLGGLLIHCAEHTQRHAGQMITTAKVVLALRAGPKR